MIVKLGEPMSQNISEVSEDLHGDGGDSSDHIGKGHEEETLCFCNLKFMYL